MFRTGRGTGTQATRAMRRFTALGPFHGAMNFLDMVALPNCQAYFKAMQGAPTPNRETDRLLFNAAVALDSVVDHLFHEHPEGEKYQDANSFMKGDHRDVDNLWKEEDRRKLEDLRDLANALKHRVRGGGKGGAFTRNDKKMHAHGYAPTEITVDVRMEADSWVAKLAVPTDRKAAHEVLEQAWQYWCRYSQQHGGTTSDLAVEGDDD